jgi:hypothetical protein
MSTAETARSGDAASIPLAADTERQTAGGKVLWHFTMSLDGFVAGPNHAMNWMQGFSHRPGLIDEYVETTGAVLGGRDGFDAFPDVSATYGGDWDGPVFILTHHPEDAPACRYRRHVAELRCSGGRPDRARGGRGARTSRSCRPRSADSCSTAA